MIPPIAAASVGNARFHAADAVAIIGENIHRTKEYQSGIPEASIPADTAGIGDQYSSLGQRVVACHHRHSGGLA